MSSSPATRCVHCGADQPADARFCPACGRANVDKEGDPLIGAIVGERYVLRERIDHGGSGTIYRGEHVTLGRKVAVKVLHEWLAREDLAIERFRREATTVSEIDNEHIVDIYDFGRTPDGRLYLAMELLAGEPLSAVIAREGRISVGRAVEVLVQLGQALMEAHAMGYVHRDLRPSNVYLAVRRGGEDFVKLLDFGLAKLVEQAGEAPSTSLGMTFGDPRYMSPEQARGEPVDRRADIYSLGCIAYEMLTGAPPFTGGQVFDIVASQVNEEPAPLRERRPDAPAWLEATVARMLAKQAEDRFITVYRLVEALEAGRSRGAVMTDELARRAESEPPPSVTRAMERLAARDVGDEADVPTAPPPEPRESPAEAVALGETGLVPDRGRPPRRRLWLGLGAAATAATLVGLLLWAGDALWARGGASGALADAGPAAAADGAAGPEEDAGDAERAAALVEEGRRALRGGEALEAASSFNRARSLDPQSAGAIAGLGEIALAQGYHDDAIAHLERAVELEPEAARYHTLLGEALLGSGDRGRAAESFARARELDPADDRAEAGHREAAGDASP